MLTATLCPHRITSRTTQMLPQTFNCIWSHWGVITMLSPSTTNVVPMQCQLRQKVFIQWAQQRPNLLSLLSFVQTPCLYKLYWARNSISFSLSQQHPCLCKLISEPIIFWAIKWACCQLAQGRHPGTCDSVSAALCNYENFGLWALYPEALPRSISLGPTNKDG